MGKRPSATTKRTPRKRSRLDSVRLGPPPQTTSTAPNHSQHKQHAFSRPNKTKGEWVERRDGWMNLATAMGTRRDKRSHGFYEADIVTDIEALQLWRSDYLSRVVIEARPDDAFRRGVGIKMDDQEAVKQIIDDLQALQMLQKFRYACKLENACGGAAILPILNDIGDLSTPLVPTGITKMTAIHVFEPRELIPVAWYSDITNPKYGKPEAYRLSPLTNGFVTTSSIQQVIHETRMVILPGRRISRLIMPGQRLGWGDSILSGVYQVIRDFGHTWGSIANIIDNFGQGILKLKDYAQLMEDDAGEEVVRRRLANMDMMASALRSMAMDKDDDFTRVTTTVSGLADLMSENLFVVCAAARMPATRLFGMSPKGMNATGESDLTNWYDDVDSWRENDIKVYLEQLIEMYMLGKDSATGGEIPDEWCIEYPSLEEPTDKEEADRRLVVAQTDKIYAIDIGAVPPETIATSRWKSGFYSAEMTIDWDEWEKQQALQAKKDDMAQMAALKAQAAIAAGKTAPAVAPNSASNKGTTTAPTDDSAPPGEVDKADVKAA